MIIRLCKAVVLSAMLASPALAETGTYAFERGFPANDETIQTARDATVLAAPPPSRTPR